MFDDPPAQPVFLSLCWQYILSSCINGFPFSHLMSSPRVVGSPNTVLAVECIPRCCTAVESGELDAVDDDEERYVVVEYAEAGAVVDERMDVASHIEEGSEGRSGTQGPRNEKQELQWAGRGKTQGDQLIWGWGRWGRDQLDPRRQSWVPSPS